MSSVLAEAFAVTDAPFGAALAGPLLHGGHVVVHAVLGAEPIALGGMAGEHVVFEGEDFGDIDDEVGLDGAVFAIEPFDGIHEVEVGDAIGGGRVIESGGTVVGGGGGKAGVADEERGHLVVGEIVGGGGGEDEIGAEEADQGGDAAAGGVIVEDGEIVKAAPLIGGSDEGGGASGFLAADASSVLRGVFAGTAVAIA